MPENVHTGPSKTIALLVVLGGVWFVWSGHTTALILSFGVGSVALSVWMSHRLQIVDAEGQPLKLGLLFYLPWLFKEIVLANIDVIKRICTFGPIDEQISLTWTKVPAKQSSRLGRVVFANSITLTPGTISVDLEESEGEHFILVNALSKDGADALIDGGEMGAKVSAAEGG